MRHVEALWSYSCSQSSFRHRHAFKLLQSNGFNKEAEPLTDMPRFYSCCRSVYLDSL